MKKQHILTAAALMVSTLGMSGQIVSHSLYYMETVPQTTLLNPARQPRCDVYVAIPGVNIFVGESTNLSPTDFVQKSGNEWLTPLRNGFDYNELYDNYKSQMAVDVATAVELLNFGWRTNAGNYITISVSERITADVALPSDLLKIADKGLPNGTLLNLSKLCVNAQAYSEIAASYSRAFGDKWTFGARAKLLAGIGTVRTKNDKFDLYTSRDQWTVTTDFEVRTSLPLVERDMLDENGIIEVDSLEFREFDETSDALKYVLSLKNPGFGLDLGATYQFNDKVQFSAAVTDLGFISWRRDVNTFKSKGEFLFEGIEYCLDNEEHRDDFENALDDCLDSLEQNIKLTVKHSKFKTALTPSIYIGAEYKPFYFLSLGFLSHTKFYPVGRANQDFNVSASLNPYKSPLTGTLGYTINVMGKSSFHCGFSLRAGVVQLYTMLDYIPLKYNNYDFDGDDVDIPHNISNFNVSFGMNLVFGSKAYRDRPMIHSTKAL